MPHRPASSYFNHYPRIEDWIKENSIRYGEAADKMKERQGGKLLPQQEAALVAVYGEEARKAYDAVEAHRVKREAQAERAAPEVKAEGERRLTKRFRHPNHHYYSRDVATGRIVGLWKNPRKKDR